MPETPRTVVITGASIGFAASAVRAFTQPRQDTLLKEMKLNGVLGGAEA